MLLPVRWGGLFGAVPRHFVHSRLFLLRKAAARVPGAGLHMALRSLMGGNGPPAPAALVFQAVEQAVSHDGLQDEMRRPAPPSSATAASSAEKVLCGWV